MIKDAVACGTSTEPNQKILKAIVLVATKKKN